MSKPKSKIRPVEFLYALVGLVIFGLALDKLQSKYHDCEWRQDDTRLMQAIAKSDDYEKHGELFLTAAKELIARKHCTVDDFEKWSGWIKSPSQPDLYHTYCGKSVRKGKILDNNRVYLRTSDRKWTLNNPPD